MPWPLTMMEVASFSVSNVLNCSAGGRGGLLPLPGHDDFPRFEGGRKSEKRPLSPGGQRDGWGGRGDRGEIHEPVREPGLFRGISLSSTV